MTNATTWRKSSRSTDQSACVEVPGSLNAVRDSKNPNGPVLPATTAAFELLVNLAKGH